MSGYVSAAPSHSASAHCDCGVHALGCGADFFYGDRIMRRTRTRILLAMWFAWTASAGAQTWPARPVRIVVPFAPGGTADTLGRIVAQKLTDSLGQSFIVENRSGAGGITGSDFVAKSTPDGYTLVVSAIASHVIAPQLG